MVAGDATRVVLDELGRRGEDAELEDVALGAPSTGSIATTRSWFRVSVPVLSVAITLADPSVSTAERRRTIAPRPAIARAPWASAIVTVAASPSGHGGDRDRHADEERLVERRTAQQHPGQEAP